MIPPEARGRVGTMSSVVSLKGPFMCFCHLRLPARALDVREVLEETVSLNEMISFM